MTKNLKEQMSRHVDLAMDDALEGARRATGDASSIAPPDPEVVATARRRNFPIAERRRILAAADGCKASGEIGALLRREGIYSSHLSTWRKQRATAERTALEAQKRGPKANPVLAETRRIEQLTRENANLSRQLAQARTIIDVQKKVCTLLGLLTDETPGGTS